MLRIITIITAAITSMQAFSSGQFIVKYKNDASRSKGLGLSSRGLLFKEKAISQRDGLYTINFPLGLSSVAIEQQLELLRSMPEVAYAQLDHVVTRRTARGDFESFMDNFAEFPNDEHVENLWNMENAHRFNMGTTNAAAAWSHFGTGGRDAYGQDIVVAVIDFGFDLSHEDLVDNYFVNEDEIPDNGIDDDGNGYVDDHTGWSTTRRPITPLFHGTHVAGIIGAKGGNGIGVVGINWDVKILPIQISVNRPTGFDFGVTLTSEVMAAYTYVMAMKRRWLETNGMEGANIVITNSSFGISRENCNNENFAAWNDLYEEMGALGILSAVATDNWNYDVDVQGDIPSGCSSDYIISVTNVKRDGQHNRGAAWGINSVDLAAPGTDIYSTVTDSWYGFQTGTSMSTPHVAGAIAYLYSVAGEGVASLYYAEPSAAALLMKKVLLTNTYYLPHFEDKVGTAGVLDIYLAAYAISEL